jgi:hypothetical protein
MNEATDNKITVAIHQPNLFPWLGFFDKINRSDVFILLDHVVNNPRNSLWTKRVQILSNSIPYWLTIPIEHSGKDVFLQINMMMISPMFNKKKHIQTILQNYNKTKYFNSVFPFVEYFYQNDQSNILAERNIRFIKSVSNELGITTKFLISSNLDPVSSASEMLIDLILKAGGTTYLYGGLGENYQQKDKFEAAGISLVAQNFQHPTYPQSNTSCFIPGLSILDALFNIGFTGVAELLYDLKNKGS